MINIGTLFLGEEVVLMVELNINGLIRLERLKLYHSYTN